METLQPKLRFQGFKDNWSFRIFDEILDITRLAGYEYSKYWKEDDKKEIIALRGYNIGKGKIEYINLGYISNKLSLQLKRSRLNKGDIVYPCVGTIGNSVVIEENDKFHIQQNIAKLTPKIKLNSYFISQFLMSEWGMNEVKRFNATSSQPNVLVGSLRNYRINIPCFEEQTKIANFLSSVDEKLHLLKEKKSLLEDYKKGVMQQLFNQEIRFKDDNGKDFGDWIDIELGDVLDYIQPTKYIVKSTDYNDEFNTPVLTAGKTFILGYTDETDNIYTKNLPVIIFDDFTTANKFVDFPFKVKSSAMKILVCNRDDVNIKYIYEFIQTLNFSTGDEHKRYWISEYSKCEIQLPCFEEQTKIANFLSAIDEKIELVAKQIEDTQEYKKGLLQQMFV